MYPIADLRVDSRLNIELGNQQTLIKSPSTSNHGLGQSPFHGAYCLERPIRNRSIRHAGKITGKGFSTVQRVIKILNQHLPLTHSAANYFLTKSYSIIYGMTLSPAISFHSPFLAPLYPFGGGDCLSLCQITQ